MPRMSHPTRALIVALTLLSAAPALAARTAPPQEKAAAAKRTEVKKVKRTDAEWRKSLTGTQYRVLRKQGTEMAFTGAYWNHHEGGTYRCAGCGLELFHSRNKYDSGTGWPSFDRPWAKEHVLIHVDQTLGMVRQEVVCARCDGHLGHVFDDGPAPTHQRYCINSAALSFEKAKPEGK